jgi:hypothetical protein
MQSEPLGRRGADTPVSGVETRLDALSESRCGSLNPFRCPRRITDIGRATENVQCVVCAAGTDLVCDWLMEDKPIGVRAREVAVGDRIAVIPRRRHPEIVCRVASIGFRGSTVVLNLQDPDGREAEWPRWPDEEIRILRRGPCRAPCCEAHTREIADNRHYCKAHWEAWQDGWNQLVF